MLTLSILLVIMIGAALALRPLGVTDGAAATLPEAGTPADSSAGAEPAARGETDKPTEPADAESLLQGELAALESAQPAESGGVHAARPEGRGSAAAAPAPAKPESPLGPAPGAETPPGGAAEQPNPDAVLQHFGVAPDSVPAEQRGPVAQALQNWWEGHYVPAAEQVRQDYAKQQQWWGQMEQFLATPAYKWAAYLNDNPQLAQRVAEYVNGLATGQPVATQGQQLPAVKPEDLDPEMRAVYATAQQALADNQRLRDEMAEVRQQLGGFGKTLQQRQAEQEAVQREQGVAHAGRLLDDLSAQYTQRLGFDIKGHRAEYLRACQHVLTQLEADQYRRATNGGARPRSADELVADVRQWFHQGLEYAGFARLHAERQRQSRTGTTPPGGRAPGAGEPETPDQLISQAIADHDAQRA
jgi:hypothetical protein